MRFSWLAGAVLLCAATSPARASVPGQVVANEVQVDSYRELLDHSLYARDGMDRGRNGVEHDLARDEIRRLFLSYGLEASLEPFTYQGETYYNVVARQTGVLVPDAQYVVGGHFDSVNNPGADDNASGVAAVLEIARVLSRYETELTITYIAFDLEELDRAGSYAYVAQHTGEDIRGMINFDMMGHDAGGRRTQIRGRQLSNALKAEVRDAMLAYGRGIQPIVGGSLSISDHAPFEEAGYPACIIVEDAYAENPCYHEPCDSIDRPDYIHYEYAADQARAVAGFLAERAVARLRGDSNCDGAVTVFDIDPFVMALAEPARYAEEHPDCVRLLADVNGDGIVSVFDIDPFIAVLID